TSQAAWLPPGLSPAVMSEPGATVGRMDLLVVIVVALVAAGAGLATGFLVAGSRSAAQVREAERAAAELRAEHAAIAAELAAERRGAAERIAALQADQARAVEQFKAVAADALKANNEHFMAVAEERLKRSQEAGAAALAQREAAVKQLVEPL